MFVILDNQKKHLNTMRVKQKDYSKILNKINGLIEETDGCHSIALVFTDGTVVVYSNHSDGLEKTHSFKSKEECVEFFELITKDILHWSDTYVLAKLDDNIQKSIKNKIPDVQEILFWAF